MKDAEYHVDFYFTATVHAAGGRKAQAEAERRLNMLNADVMDYAGKRSAELPMGATERHMKREESE